MINEMFALLSDYSEDDPVIKILMITIRWKQGNEEMRKEAQSFQLQRMV